MNEEVSFGELVSTVLKKWWIVAICAIVFGVLGGGYAKHKQVTSYTADAQITIAHNYSRVIRKDDMFKVDTDMAPTYEKLDTNRNILTGVKKAYHEDYGKKLGYDTAQLRDRIDITATSGTVIYTVSVQADTPKKAVQLTNVTTKVLEKQVPNLIPNAGNVKLLSKASKDNVLTHKSSSVKKFAVVGFVFGALISIFGIAIKLFLKK